MAENNLPDFDPNYGLSNDLPDFDPYYGLEKPKEDTDSDIVRGAKNSFRQLPQLGYGLEAAAGATAENLLGEGGISTKIKEHGLKNYREESASLDTHSKPTDSLTYSWDKAVNDGDLSALGHWIGYGLGYGGGQILQALATAGVGSAMAQAGSKVVGLEVAEKLAANEAKKLTAEYAEKLTAGEITEDQIKKQAVKNVASAIGENSALAATSLVQEGGEIGGDLVDKASKEGRQLTGDELAKAFGASLGAGALEFVGDKFNLGLIKGKSALANKAADAISSAPGWQGRALRGAAAGTAGLASEAGQEAAQTYTEEFGKGNDLTSPETTKQVIDSAGLGGLTGGSAGFVGGAVRPATNAEPPPPGQQTGQTGQQQDTSTQQSDITGNQPDISANQSQLFPGFNQPTEHTTDSILERMATLEMESQQRELTPQEVAEYHALNKQIIQADQVSSTTTQEANHGSQEESAQQNAGRQGQEGLLSPDGSQPGASSADAQPITQGEQTNGIPSDAAQPTNQANPAEAQSQSAPGQIPGDSANNTDQAVKGFSPTHTLFGTPVQQVSGNLFVDANGGEWEDDQNEAEPINANSNAGISDAALQQPTPENPGTGIGSGETESSLGGQTGGTAAGGIAGDAGRALPNGTGQDASGNSQPGGTLSQEQVKQQSSNPEPKFTFKGDGLDVYVTPNIDGSRFNVTAKDQETGEALSFGKIFNNEADAVAFAKKSAGIKGESSNDQANLVVHKRPDFSGLPDEAKQSFNSLYDEIDNLESSKAGRTKVVQDSIDRQIKTIKDNIDRAINSIKTSQAKSVQPNSGADNQGNEVATGNGENQPKVSGKKKDKQLTALNDDRIQEYGDTLKAMAKRAGWAQKGGELLRDTNGNVTGRTNWLPHEDWYAEMPGDARLNSQDSIAAVDKAIAGEPMTAKEKRAVSSMMDYLDYQRENAGRQSSSIDFEEEANKIAASKEAEAEREAIKFEPEVPEDEYVDILFTESHTSHKDLTDEQRQAIEDAIFGTNHEVSGGSEKSTEAQKDEDTGGRSSEKGASGIAESENQDRQEGAKRRPGESGTEGDQGNVETSSGISEAAQKAADDFKANRQKIINDLTSKGQIKPLYDAAGVMTAGLFKDLPLADQIAAYVKMKTGEVIPGAPKKNKTPVEVDMFDSSEEERKARESKQAAADLAAKKDQKRQGNGEEPPALFSDNPAFAGQQDIADTIKEDKRKDKIDDFGEKIGGARKDVAEKTSEKSKSNKVQDERPAWERRYSVGESVGEITDTPWVLRDDRSKNAWGNPKLIGKFKTEQEAKDAIPLAEVGRNHRAVPGDRDADGNPTYEIWRDISDRKRVKVVDKSFASRDEAMRYMADHAVEIIETNTTFGEADLPRPASKERTGVDRRTGDATDKDFMQDFGLRGVEFGNWNNQDERQELMNDAYDGLMDLAEVLNIPPKAIGLNGDLALAFGARGKGLSGAKAHYETDKVVINLTKMNGAGSLAHEWFHALDHYFGRQSGQASSEWTVDKDGTRTLKVSSPENDFVSHGFSYKTKVRPELVAAYKNVIDTMFHKAEQFVEDTQKADKWAGKAKQDLADSFDNLRKELSAQKDPKYYKRNNKPATAEQLVEYDTLVKKILDGESLKVDWQTLPGNNPKGYVARYTNDALEGISKIYKDVRGRSGFDGTNRNGPMDRISSEMRRYQDRLVMLNDAKTSTVKERKTLTDFAMAAKSLDQGRGTNYWTTPHEMASRAFQGYVEDKIKERSSKSPFLNYGPENVAIDTPWGPVRPFPAGAERKAINKAFDEFVSILKTKETEKGVSLLSRGNVQSKTEAPLTELTGNEIQGSTPAHARKNANRFIEEMINALIKETGSDTLHNNPTGFDIRLTKKGVVHGYQHKGSQHIKAVAGIKSLIENALPVATNPHDPKVNEWDSVHTLVSPLKIGDKFYAVKLTVKEGREGFKLYDHEALEMAKPVSIDAGLDSSAINNDEKLGYSSITGLNVSLEHMLSAFKGENEKYLPAKLSIGGINALNANKDALSKAMQMDLGKRSPQAIWRETGWYKGDDGRWRFEIDDSEASLVDGFDLAKTLEKSNDGNLQMFYLEDIFSDPKLYENYPGIRDLRVQFLKQDGQDYGGYADITNGLIAVVADPRMNKDRLENILVHEIQHMIQAKEQFANGGDASEQTVSYVLRYLREEASRKYDHKAMKEYKRLADELGNLYRVSRYADLIDYANRDSITRNSKLLYQSSQYQQHYREVWDNVGYPPSKRNTDKHRRWLQETAMYLANKMEADNSGKRYSQQIRELEEIGPNELKNRIARVERRLDRVRPVVRAWEIAEQKIEAAKNISEKGVDGIFTSSAKHDFYMSLAGEVEARMVEARRKLTPEERRELIPSSSEDRYGQSAIQSPSRPGSVNFKLSSGIPVNNLQKMVDRIASTHKNLPTVHVLNDITEAPEALQRDVAAQNASDTVEGAYHNGELYLFAKNLNSIDRAEFVLAEHEVTHIGLRGILGSDVTREMNKLYNNNARIRKLANQYNARGALTNAQAVEEILADMAPEELAGLKGWRGLLAKIAEWFHNHGFTKVADFLLSDQTKSDLYAAELVKSARNWVKTGETIHDSLLTRDSKLSAAWHGSPHDHDRFDSSKIGTGEGNQAFGYGLYFTDKKDIAEFYRKTLSGDKNFSFGAYTKLTREEVQGLVSRRFGGDFLDNVTRPSGVADRVMDDLISGNDNPYKKGSERHEMYNELKSRISHDGNAGKLYQVELAPSEDEYLDWGKPLSGQSSLVKEALKKAGVTKGYNENLSDYSTPMITRGREKRGNNIYAYLEHVHGSDKAASDYLHSLGIRGIRYKAEQGKSRANNYVIFNDEDVSIVSKLSRGEEKSLTEQIYDELRKQDGIFQNPPVEGTDLVQIMADVAPFLKFKDQSKLGEHVVRTEFTLPNNLPAYVFEDGNEVWIDVSNSSPGMDTAAMYAAMGNYANNTGKIFIDDPAGVSPDAVRRRPVHMQSLALKYGTTKFLGKSKNFDERSIMYGLPVLDWTGSDEDRMNSLLRHNIRAVYRALPELRSIHYDFTRHKFESNLGTDLPDTWHKSLAESRAARENNIGESTIRRAVFLESIASSTGSEKSRILEHYRNDERLANSADRQIKGILSRGNIQPQQLNPLQKIKAKVSELTSPEAIDKLIYELADKYIDLKRLREHIKAIGGTINDLNDAYEGETLYHARVAKQTKDFLDKEIKPLLAGLRAANIKPEEFEQFLHARHAPEANAVLAKRNPNQAEIDVGKQSAKDAVNDLLNQLSAARKAGSATKSIEDALHIAQQEQARWRGAQAFQGTENERSALSGMTDAEAQAVMDGLSPAKKLQMEALAAQVDAIQEKTLESLVKNGLMSRQDIDTWKDTYQHYIPLHRDEAHPDSVSHPIGQGFSTRGDASKRRTGSNQKVTNILAHIAMQRESAITRGEKNNVMKRLYLMARQNPLPDFWKTDSAVYTKTIDDNGFVRTVIDQRYKDKPNVLMLRIAGKDTAIVFNEHDEQAARLAMAMKNLDVDDLHYLIPFIGKGTRWLASVNTQYNPIFGIINLMRDAQSGMLNLESTRLAGNQAEVMKNAKSILGDILRNGGRMPKTGQWARLYDEFQNVGGTTGYRELYMNPEDRAKALLKELESMDRGKVSEKLHKFVDWLSDYNEAMENSIRLAAYKTGIDAGMSKQRAAVMAKNLTVNFNRKGRQAREIGALYAFFNASVQGSARMIETLKSPAGKKIIAGGLALGAIQTMIGMAMMGGGDGDDDQWKKIPQFIKERNFIIPISHEDYISIPMPLGFHFIPNIGRLAVETAMYGPKSAGKNMVALANVLADAFNPLGGSNSFSQILAPSVLDPVVALMENKDWTGKPIYKEDMSSLDVSPGFKRTKTTASPWSKAIAEAINDITGGTDYTPGAMSPTPDQIDFVIGQLTGGTGRELSKVADVADAVMTGEDVAPYKIPLAGRLYGNTRGQAGQSDAFYDNLIKSNIMESNIKGRIKDGISPADYIKENPNALQIAALGNRADSMVKKLRDKRNMLIKSDAPQSSIKPINDMITQTMRDFNNQMDKLDQ